MNVTDVAAQAFRVVKLSTDSTFERYGLGITETSVMVALVEPLGGVNQAEPVAGSLNVTAAVNTPGQLGLLPPPITIVPGTIIAGPFVPRAEDIGVAPASAVLSCPSPIIIAQLVSRIETATSTAGIVSRFRVLFIGSCLLVMPPGLQQPNNNRAVEWSGGRFDNPPATDAVKLKNQLSCASPRPSNVEHLVENRPG